MNHLPQSNPQARRGVGRVYGRMLALAGIFAFLFTAQAQMFGTGLIRGKVQDAATREYMENVTVTVEETGQSTLTDQYGEYRLNRVPGGIATLTMTHNGYYEGTQQVTVTDGSLATPGVVQLRGRGAFDSADDEVYELAAFEVRRQTDSQSIALNQQRVSDNNKLVVDSGAFGENTEGNIGEFVKNLPGVNINYVASDPRTISVRGMADNFTPVTVDGNRMASAASGAKSRDFELEQLSLSNVERVEVTKVPTPDMAADSLGGSVNLVSKSAFEREGREIKYNVYMNANSEAMSLSKTPGWGDDRRSKMLPGLDFSYADVFAEGNAGFIFTYKNSNQYYPQHRSRNRWRTDDGVPVLQRYMIQDGPKFTHRESAALKTDFKLGENTILSLGTQWNNYSTEFRNRNITWDTNIKTFNDSDANDDGYVTNTAVLTDFGKGDIDLGGSWRNKFGDTWHNDIKLKHFVGDWTIDARAFHSHATNLYKDFGAGQAMAVISDYDPKGQMMISGYGDPMNGIVDFYADVTLYDLDGNVVPDKGASDLSNFDMTEIQTREQYGVDVIKGVNVDVKRNIMVGENPGFVKAGLGKQSQERRASRPRTRLVYTGSEMKGGMPEEQYYSRQDLLYLPGIVAWPDYEDLHDYYEANTDLFEPGRRTAENIQEQATQVFDVEEDISSAYVMGQLKFFDRKLKVTGGFRYEKTEVSGVGAFFDESLGQGFEEDSAEQLTAQWSNRLRASSDYDDIYPSLHFVYDINRNSLVRFAYAKTIGRQNFSTIVPNTDFDFPTLEEDPDEVALHGSIYGSNESDGDVTFNNVGLLPQEADNFDLSYEFYPETGGQISVGVFRKNISNYITSYIGDTGDLTDAEMAAFYLPAYLQDQDHDEFRFETDVNGGDAKVDGLEVSYYQPLELDSLPSWMHAFGVNANATFLDLELTKANGAVLNDLEDLVKTTYNFGISYDKKPLKVMLKWNSKGKQLAGTYNDMRDTDADKTAFNLYRDGFDSLDVNVEYKINDKSRFFISGRNVLKTPIDQIVESPDGSIVVGERSEEYGIQWSFGIKGKF